MQRMGYIVHYATNTLEPHYVSYQKEIQKMGVFLHHIDIARSPFVWQDNQRALHRFAADPSLFHSKPSIYHTR